MSDFYERISGMSQKRLMLLAMELQEKLEAAEAEKNPPVAIIGMACRFPGGANTPEQLWDMLLNGVDGIADIPSSRWDVEALYDPDPNAPGKIATRWGGFLNDIDRFDPLFFGISPREAITMDPQQRMMLEVVWEALERAGYPPDSLSGTLTGMFVGVCNNDYAQLVMSGDPAEWDMYVSTGNAPSVVSGRVSYILGLQGPAVTIDTACSSSLVATHLACQSLRSGECRVALAGGVNLILSPETTVMLSRAGMMASDGHCKAFDDSADGFVRSEGCGVVVLKRLSDALADNDPILAVIRGSASNQDGRSNGLTAPNGPSQVSVIRAALANAGVEPAEVGYIETHGTGTSLGDPIEVQALGAALGAGHSSENPLMIGTIKANVGHMEASAGVGGLIKAALTVQQGQIPPHLHLHKLSSYIPWDELPIHIPTQATPWEGHRIAGVSSFGFSGTNAHILVEAPPKAALPDEPLAVERPAHILTLSGRSEKALRELASRFQGYLAANPAAPLADVAYTANVGRSHFNRRLALVASSTTEVNTALSVYLNGEKSEQVVTGQALPSPEIAFLFSGHGAQYVDMGRNLYHSQPVFRQAFERCDELFQRYIDKSLSEVVFSDQGADGSLLDNMAYAQPALFALQYALAQVWLSWGVKPTVVTGHSLGEYAAAVVSGVFSLEDGVKLVAARGRLMNSLPETGEMVAVFADEATVSAAVKPYASRVSVAVINAPTNIVISGAKDALAQVLETLKGQGIKSRKLAVAQASHSPLIDPMLTEFEAVAATVQFHEPDINLVSCTTGQIVTGEEIGNAAYWRRHIRQPVRFADAISGIYQQGIRTFIEIGPNPTLIGIAQRALEAVEGVWVPSIREKSDDWAQILNSLGQLYVNGTAIDWKAFDQDYPRHKLILPTYPFQRDRYWIKSTLPKSTISMSGRLHPLIGRRLQSPSLTDIVFETPLSAESPAFLSHHRIFGVVILPSPAYMEMALAAARIALGDRAYGIENFTIYEALILPEDGFRTAQIILQPKDDRADFQIVSRGHSENDWKRHVTGSIVFEKTETRAVDLVISEVQARCSQEIEGEDYYARVREIGLEFGSSFRGITHIWRRDGEALGQLELPDALIRETRDYGIHPAFLDACFHLVGAPLSGDDFESAYLLIAIEHFRLYQSPPNRLWVYTRADVSQNKETFSSDIFLLDEAGILIGEATGLQLKRAGREALLQAVQQRFDDWFYQVEWKPKPHPGLTSPAVDYLPALQSLAEQGIADLRSLSDENQLETYLEVRKELDAVSAAYIVRGLEQLGVELKPGERMMRDALGVSAKYQPLFKRLLDTLQADGILRQSGDELLILRGLTLDPDTHLASLKQRYPAYEAEINLLGQCGPHLAEVLRGHRDPLGLLFPQGSLKLTERLYQDAPFARAYNTLVGQVISMAVQNRPVGRPLRILEIGAGSGATTAYVLPILPTDQVEYVFTDLSVKFLAEAEEKFKAYPFLKTQLLDIERNPLEQGFAAHSFDIVIAANVIHATADLRQTLKHVRQILAPQGLLVLLEGTQPQRWVDLTFGLTEGWWKFSDHDVRPSYPIVNQQTWLDLLSAAGFAEAAAIPGVDEHSVLAGQAVILAKNPLAEILEAKSSQAAHWLIFSDSSGVGEALAHKLRQRGDRALLVSAGMEFSTLAEGHWQVNPSDRAGFTRLLGDIQRVSRQPLTGIVHLWSLEMPDVSDLTPVDDLQEAQLLNAASVAYITQAILQSSKSNPPLLWLGTCGAENTFDPHISQASLWGLGRVIALEHPEIWGGLIELDHAANMATNANYLMTEITSPDGEDQVAWRDGKRSVARLVRSRDVARQSVPLRKDAAYLITGGLGGLGLKVAHWMAQQGAGHLILIGRKGLPEREQWTTLASDSREAQQVSQIQAMEALGARVTIIPADIADETRMAEVIALFGVELPPLKGIIHAAADLNNCLVADLNMDALGAMFRPKIAGTWILHRLTREIPLDFFVLFSSTTALWGSKFLAHYAAANHFLDAFAQYRRSLGLPALSINWGTWDMMRVASSAEQQEVSQSGLNQMDSAQALQIMGDLLGTQRSDIVIASVEWDGLKAIYEARRPRPFLEQVSSLKRSEPKDKQAVSKGSELLAQLKAAPLEARRDILLGHIRLEAASVLRISDPEAIDLNQGLFEMGMDSLMSVELKSRLEAAVEQPLPSTLTFNYPTVAELAGYLEANINALKSTEADASLQVPPILAAPAQMNEALAEEVDDLSEDELADLLAKKLGYTS